MPGGNDCGEPKTAQFHRGVHVAAFSILKKS